jgi:hypothetical protein
MGLRIIPFATPHMATRAGWILHFTVGWVFTLVYLQVFKSWNLRPGIPTGIVTGAITGVVAVSIWDTCLRLHPAAPRVNRKKFYFHLLVAHVIFAAMIVPLLRYALDRKGAQRNARFRRKLVSIRRR